ncbi:hypothetical protein OG225_07380 [Nocardia sp. NBC_01377]|uniref:hypothetical protein n=1 Tax=Nocardia sp. NBC_01377 TaxID=2903595 RepID=UPI0032548BA2
MAPEPVDPTLNPAGTPIPLSAIPELALQGEKNIDMQEQEHGSSKLSVLERIAAYPREYAAYIAVRQLWASQNWELAGRLLDEFWENHSSASTDPRRGGTPIRLSDDEMRETISTPWANKAIFNGQTYVGSMGGDQWEGPSDAAHPHVNGIQDEIDLAVAYANEHQQYGAALGFQAPWLVTPSDINNGEPEGSWKGDVHNAFGHYYLGSTGVIVVEPPGPDGTQRYRVWYQTQAWKYYSFKDVPDGGGFDVHDLGARMNNQMRQANQDGFANNFQVAGSTGLLYQDGRTNADGKAPRYDPESPIPWRDAIDGPPAPGSGAPSRPLPPKPTPPRVETTPPKPPPATTPPPPSEMPPPAPAPKPPRNPSIDVSAPLGSGLSVLAHLLGPISLPAWTRPPTVVGPGSTANSALRARDQKLTVNIFRAVDDSADRVRAETAAVLSFGAHIT